MHITEMKKRIGRINLLLLFCVTMKDERRKVIQRYYEELFNEGRVELVEDLLASDYENHSPGSADQSRRRDGVREVVLALRRAFPDLHYEIEDMVIGPNAVAVRTTVTGTHRGEFWGAAPTGRKVRASQMTIEHFREDVIVRHHRVTDELTLLRQLGILP